MCLSWTPCWGLTTAPANLELLDMDIINWKILFFSAEHQLAMNSSTSCFRNRVKLRLWPINFITAVSTMNSSDWYLKYGNRWFSISTLRFYLELLKQDGITTMLSKSVIFIQRYICSRAAPLGSIPEVPAKSCLEIQVSEGLVASGKYWLNPTGSMTFQVRCSVSF